MTHGNDPENEEAPADGRSRTTAAERDEESSARPELDPTLDDDLTLDDSEDDDLEDDDLDAEDDEFLEDTGSVFVLCARRPFEDWVRGVIGESADWTLPAIGRCHAIVTPELPTQAQADAWLEQHVEPVFAEQLEGWTSDETAWPDLSIETFRRWFDVVFAPTLDDFRGGDPERPSARTEVTCAPLSLRQVVAEFLRLPLDGSLHVDVGSGELFAWTDAELEAIHAGDAASYGVEPADMRELQNAFASESLVEIAHRTDIDHIDTRVTFVATIEPGGIRKRLLDALHGKRALRRFAQTVHAAGLRNRWSAWFERTASETLRQVMEERGVPFDDDLEDRSADANGHPPERP